MSKATDYIDGQLQKLTIDHVGRYSTELTLAPYREALGPLADAFTRKELLRLADRFTPGELAWDWQHYVKNSSDWKRVFSAEEEWQRVIPASECLHVVKLRGYSGSQLWRCNNCQVTGRLEEIYHPPEGV